jgi:hypothetical protein
MGPIINRRERRQRKLDGKACVARTAAEGCAEAIDESRLRGSCGEVRARHVSLLFKMFARARRAV